MSSPSLVPGSKDCFTGEGLAPQLGWGSGKEAAETAFEADWLDRFSGKEAVASIGSQCEGKRIFLMPVFRMDAYKG